MFDFWHIALVTWLVCINLFGFAIVFVDKRRAIKNRWRIKEATLFLVAALGGAIGVYMGMRTFRHKTQKTAFCIGVPLLIVVNAITVIALTVFVL